VESSDAGGGFQLNEWEIYGQETANLAFGQRVDVSDAQDCCPGYLANDSRYETFWASQPRPTTAPGEPTPVPPANNPWIRLRLPAGTPIEEMRIWWDRDAYPFVYDVYLYNDQNPKALRFKSYAEGGRDIISWTTPLRADAVLLYTINLPPERFLKLFELEVFGPEAPLGMPLLRLPKATTGGTWQWISPKPPVRMPPPDPRRGDDLRAPGSASSRGEALGTAPGPAPGAGAFPAPDVAVPTD
jgi:hypothetical protein